MIWKRERANAADSWVLRGLIREVMHICFVYHDDDDNGDDGDNGDGDNDDTGDRAHLRRGAFRNKSSPDWHSGPVVPLKSLKIQKQ